MRAKHGVARTAALVVAVVVAFVGSPIVRPADAQVGGIVPPQDAPIPPGPRSVEGRVVRPLATGPVPVPGTVVTLHRVGRDRAGALDSVRTDALGRYRLAYRARGSGDAVYFTSTRYGGIAYFTSPLRARDVRGEDAEIAVFDTTSRPIPLHLQGRHVVLGSATADGTRPVIEVFEISNDTTLTRVAAADTGATWIASLPAGAANVRVREGDITPDAVTIAGGEARVVAPFGPGLKQLVLAYDLPPNVFPLSIAVVEWTSVLEVLLEDSLASLSGGRLVDQGPVSIEGRQFRRWLGNDVPTGQAVVITVPDANADGTAPWLPVLIGATALVLAFAFWRARSRPVIATGTPLALAFVPDECERLARQIAELDRAYAGAIGETAQPEDAYQQERLALKARLVAALAVTDRAE